MLPPWWNAVAINVPAQKRFYSSANGRLLNDLVRNAREANRSGYCSGLASATDYRTVRCAEEQIALPAGGCYGGLPFISDDTAVAISQRRTDGAGYGRDAYSGTGATGAGQRAGKTGCHLSTGGGARSPLIKRFRTVTGHTVAGGVFSAPSPQDAGSLGRGRFPLSASQAQR